MEIAIDEEELRNVLVEYTRELLNPKISQGYLVYPKIETLLKKIESIYSNININVISSDKITQHTKEEALSLFGYSYFTILDYLFPKKEELPFEIGTAVIGTTEFGNKYRGWFAGIHENNYLIYVFDPKNFINFEMRCKIVVCISIVKDRIE